MRGEILLALATIGMACQVVSAVATGMIIRHARRAVAAQKRRADALAALKALALGRALSIRDESNRHLQEQTRDYGFHLGQVLACDLLVELLRDPEVTR